MEHWLAAEKFGFEFNGKDEENAFNERVAILMEGGVGRDKAYRLGYNEIVKNRNGDEEVPF